MFRAPARGTFACGGKSTQKRHLNLRFKNPPALSSVKNLRPFTARSQKMFDSASYDELPFFLRRCRSCNATVEPKRVFVMGISGSGAGVETIR